MFSRRQIRLAAILLACALAVSAAGAFAYWLSQFVGLSALQTTGRHRLDLYAASLEREIGKYAYFPATLGLEREVLELLAHPREPVIPPKVSRYLEALNERAGTLAIYVIDPGGKVIASSNWQRPDSFVGEDLAFRPYFKDALAAGHGRFFGIGTTRSEPGYYLSSALSLNGKTAGVAVVKVGLEQLEKSWSTAEAPVMVSDENGIVILSSVPSWKFASLRPLDAATRAAFDASQQYNRKPLPALGLREILRLTEDDRLIELARPAPDASSLFPLSGQFLAQTQLMPGTSWHLTVLSQTTQLQATARSHAALSAIGSALLLIVILMWHQRQRHLRAQLAARAALQKAHDELERKVEERTADLSNTNLRLQEEVSERRRTEHTLRQAQEELLQAGKLAIIGQLSTSIAHELNQPLAALRTLSGNTVRFLERNDLATVRSNLERIGQLVDRMGGITSQLRSFARKSPPTLGTVDLRHALDNTLSLLEQRLQQGRIEVRIDFPPEEVLVRAEANRLEQVLINLVSNAIEAMHSIASPRLDVHCRSATGKTMLSLRDNGEGLTPDDLEHLFEAFRTSKESGVGLGLVICAGIVQEFGGTLAGANHPQGGAVFTLTLISDYEGAEHG